MPIYTYKCRRCGNREEEFRKVDERNEPEQCNCCGAPMDLVPSVPADGYTSGYPYFDKILDQEIMDPGHRRKVLKQQGLEERG